VDAATQDVKSQNGDVQIVDTLIMNLETARKSIMVEGFHASFFFLFLGGLLIVRLSPFQV
jgi:hypothetical protein